jgi:protein arginine kinase
MAESIKDRKEDVIVSSRIRLARNLRHHRFPHAFQDREAAEIDETFLRALSGDEIPGTFRHVALRNVDLVNRRVMMENHLISPELIKNRSFSSFFLREDEKVTLMINEEDHLRLQVLLNGFDLWEAYRIAADLDDKLEDVVDFAFDDELGYLTACPTNTGTGLRASVMVHLPGMHRSGLIPGLADSLSKIGLTVRGLYGEGSQALGDLFQISNQKTLGMSEEQVIEKLESIVERIVKNERKIRRDSLRYHRIEVEDQVFRALGTLKYARKIGDAEALQCLSNLRVGIDLGIYDGLRLDQILFLMYRVQKYNIIKYKREQELTKSEDAVRAGFLNDFFAKEEIT